MSRSKALLAAAVLLTLASAGLVRARRPAPLPAPPPAPVPEVLAPLRVERRTEPPAEARAASGRVDGRRRRLPGEPPRTMAPRTAAPSRESHGTAPLYPSLRLSREDVLHERDGSYGYVTPAYGATLDAQGFLLGAHREYEDIGQPLLAFRLVDVRMGGQLLATGGDLRPAARPEDRSVHYARPGVEERYELRKEGVEQLFVLRELPESRDAIVVTGAVETNVETPADGTLAAELVFPHGGNGGFTISNAAAFDAAGRRIDLLLAFAEGRMSMTIPADWVREAAAPITIDPLFGAAFTIDANAVDPWFWSHNVIYGDALNEWLFVWNERTGAASSNNDIFAQRLGADGALIGPAIQVTATQTINTDSGVSWIGGGVNRYLVVWSEPDGSGYARVMGRLMNPDGTWYAAAFVIKDTPPGPGNVFDRWPAIATDGAGFFVAYTTHTMNASTFQWEGSLRGRTVSATGALGGEILIDSFAADYARARISYTSGAYCVIYARAYLGSNQYGLYGRTLNAAGTPTSPVMNPGAASIGMYDVAGGNGRFLITWPEQGTWRLFAQTIDTSFNIVALELLAQGSSDWPHSAAPVWIPAHGAWFVPYVGPDSTFDLWARRVEYTGLLGPVERLTNTAELETMPRVSLNPATQHLLITYVQNLSDPYLFRALRYAVGSPPPPLNFAGTATSSSAIQWSWTNPPGELSFELHDDLHAVKGLPAANTTSFTETGLAENTLYIRHLHSVTAGGLSGSSNAGVRYTLVQAPVAADLTLTVDSSSQITAAAAAPPNPTYLSTGCEIQRSPDNAAWTTVKAFSNVYSHASTGLSAATTYWFRVRYRNVEGVVTGYSPSKSAVTAPPAAAGLAGTAQSVSSVLWSWTNVAGETGYQLHDDAHVLKGSTGVDVVSFTETGLLENSPASRHVHAVNAGAPGAPSATLVRFTRVHDPTSADVAVAVVSTTQVDVAVAAPPNATAGSTGCEIQRSPDNVAWTTVKAFSSVYGFSNTGLTANTLYYFRARYRNGDGTATAYSAVKSVRTAVPAVPASFAGSALSTSSIQWTWGDVADESGFQLHDAGEAVKGTAAAGVLSFSETGLFENAAYARHVHAVNGSLRSGGSTAATVYTRVHDPVAADFAPRAVSSSQIDVVAVAPPNGTAGSTGCEIQRSPDNATWTTVKAFSNVYTHSSTGLTAATTYYFRIRYRNGNGTATAYSPSQSSATSLPAAPTGFAGAAKSTTSIEWSWTGVNGEASYALHDAAEASKGTAPANAAKLLEATGLTENLNVTRHLHAVNGLGTGPASAAVSLYTLVRTPTEAHFSALVVSATSVEIAVTAPPNSTAGSTGCEIQKSADGATWTTIKSFSNVYTHTDAAFTGAARYRFSYRNGNGVVSGPSPVKVVLSAPLLLAPAADGATNDTTPAFDWTDLPGKAALTYELQADDASNFSSPAVNVTALATSAYTPAAALPAGLYYWRARGKFAGANLGPWSAVGTFRIDTTAPGVPVLNSPAAGASVGTGTPLLDWTLVSDPSGVTYEIQVDNDATFATPDSAAKGVASSSFTVPVALAAGTWNWRVRAVDDAGNIGGWSAARTFVVDLTAPAAFLLTAPADNTVVTTGRPAFSWAAASGASAYALEVDTEGSFAAPLSLSKTGLTGTTYTPTTAETLAGGSYVWRVRASDAAGNAVASAVWRFTVDTTSAPSAPRLALSNARKTSDTTPLITGSSSEPSTAVKVYFNGTLDGQTTSDAAGAWSYTATAKTANGPAYVVTARTSNANGDSPPSNAVELAIDTVCAPPTAVSATPLNGRIHLTWVRSSDPDAVYEVFRKLKTDPDTSYAKRNTGWLTGTEFCDTGTNGTEYAYRVRAVDRTLAQ